MEEQRKLQKRVARDLLRINPTYRAQKVFKLKEFANIDQQNVQTMTKAGEKYIDLKELIQESEEDEELFINQQYPL